MSTRFSCVIPTHNRSDYLAEALRSVGAQTEPPLEVIVASDVADAAAEQVCAAFEADSGIPTRFVAYGDSAGGASESRNRGAQLAQGDHLAFLDDDDTWAPNYLASVRSALEQTDAAIVVTWIMMFRNDQFKLGPAIAEGLGAQDVVAVNAGTTGSNMVVLKSAFEEVGGFDPELRMKNDTDFFFRFLDAGNSYAVVPLRLVYQRKHDSGQLTGHSAARADFTELYAKKHGDRLTRRDKRSLAFVVHRIRRHSAPTALGRAYHLVLSVANYSVKQYRIDQFNKNDKQFFAVPPIDDRAAG